MKPARQTRAPHVFRPDRYSAFIFFHLAVKQG